jgi:hypothetical protein
MNSTGGRKREKSPQNGNQEAFQELQEEYCKPVRLKTQEGSNPGNSEKYEAGTWM